MWSSDNSTGIASVFALSALVMQVLTQVHHNNLGSIMKATAMQDLDKLTLCMLSMGALIIQYSRFRCQNPDFHDFISNHHLGGAESKFAGVLDGWSLSHFAFF